MAKLLNAQGYRTRDGKEWRDIQVSRVLIETSAKGIYLFNRTKKHGDWKSIAKPECEWGRIECAEYRKAVALKPDFAAAHTNLGNALKEEAQFDGVMECYLKAVTLKPKDTLMHSNMVYTALFHPGYDTHALREQCAVWDALHGEPRRKFHQPHTNIPDPERRLRIGYVSPNLSRHVIHHFFLPLLEAHDRAGFEIFCYASVKVPDAVTHRMMKSTDVWRDAFGMAEQELAERIRGDGIDILVGPAISSN